MTRGGRLYRTEMRLQPHWRPDPSTNQLQVAFEEKVYVQGIDIYETMNAGAVTRIQSRRPDGQWDTVWSTDRPSRIEHSRIFSPQIRDTMYQSNALRIEVDCTAAHSWCELDAVKVKGRNSLIAQAESTLTSDLQKLVNNRDFSDVIFHVEGKKIYAHRNILSVRSDYFNAMFTDGMKESQESKPITMQDVGYDAFLGMLYYIYTDTLEYTGSSDVLVSLIRISDQFSLEGLRTQAHQYLIDQITVDNVVDIYCKTMEKLPVLEDVRQSCINFMAPNIQKVSHTTAFCKLSQETMLDIIQETTQRLHLS